MGLAVPAGLFRPITPPQHCALGYFQSSRQAGTLGPGAPRSGQRPRLMRA